MPFKKGDAKPGPGRPASGFTKVANAIDSILVKPENIAALKKSMQKTFDESPVDFLKEFGYLITPSVRNKPISNISISIDDQRETVGDLMCLLKNLVDTPAVPGEGVPGERVHRGQRERVGVKKKASSRKTKA